MKIKNCWNRKSRMILLEHLEMYVSSGLPVNVALEALGGSISKKRVLSLRKVKSAHESGQELSKALELYVRLPSSVVGLIATGEKSGTLGKMLKTAHSLLERQDELIKKVMSAMTYPAVIGLATVALTLALVHGIMPQIIPLLESLNTDLPLLTVIVMNSSKFVTAYGHYVLLGIVSAAIILNVVCRKSIIVRYLIHRLGSHLPILGKLLDNYFLSLFFRSFGSLVLSGISGDKAYIKSVASVNLLPLRARLRDKLGLIEKGEKFAVIADGSMPIYARPLIEAGESSGALGNALIRISELIDRELEHSLKRLTALIEPIMMIGMGSVVGAISLSIMMPIYDISRAIQM